MWFRKPRPAAEPAPAVTASAVEEANPLLEGVPRLSDLLVPGGYDRSAPDVFRAGPFWIRSLAVTGLPAEIENGWLQPFLRQSGHLDLALHIDPYEERSALDYLTRLITTLRARFRFVSHLTGQSSELVRAIEDLERIRDLVAKNHSRLFRLSTVATVLARDPEQLREASELLDNALALRRIYAKGLEARQDEGYLSVLPLGQNFVADIFRNLDSFATATAMPFTEADLIMTGGFQLGVNLSTGAPILLNLYDRSLNNHNMVCYAGSGAGKSATVKTMIGRSLLLGERHAIIDPEGEYTLATQHLGGVTLPLGPGSEVRLNPFDVSAETDERGTEVVPLQSKVMDLVDLIRTMVGAGSPDQAAVELAVIDASLRELYHRFGITNDPASLLVRASEPEPDGTLRFRPRPKRMPRLSDLVEVLKEHGDRAARIAAALGPYTGDGILGFFDCESNIAIADQRLVSFDISRLDQRIGKPVALQVILTWLWSHFMVKNAGEPKRVTIDEAWLMTASEAGMDFLENGFRRSRKRGGGFTVISQDFRRFARHPKGEAIHSNSQTVMLLRAEEHDLDDIQRMFHLSDGERGFIAQAAKGAGLLRMQGRVYPFQVLHTPSETQWVYTSPLREG